MPNRKTPPVYFTSLEIENVRCFGDLQQLDLTADGRRPARWTLILGDNGVGKTTLLQSLTWMRPLPSNPVPGKPYNSLLDEENVFLERLRKDRSGVKLTLKAKLSIGSALSSARGTVKGKTGPGKPHESFVQLIFDAQGQLSQDPKSDDGLSEGMDEPLVIVYGANRHMGFRNAAKRDFEGDIASRLSGLTELYDIEQILSELDHASARRKGPSDERSLKQLKESLVRILPEEVGAVAIHIFPHDIYDHGERSGVHLKTFTGIVPMSELSLGYQTTLAWTGDLAFRLQKHYPDSRNPLAEPAVVLIDEIDLHLHPRWQLRIMDDLSTIFRRTQFVATSHSPLMVQVATTANFVLLRKREKDVEIVNEPGDVRNWRVDQILTSDLFGLPGARNKQTELLFAKRDELAAMPSLSLEQETELERLRVQISEIPTAGDPQDQEAMELIRKAAALLKQHDIFEP